MKFILLFFIILFSSCAKQTSTLICGDHVCINKAEAKQYFEENLTIEVQIISNDKKTRYDLVDLNTGSDDRSIKIFKSKNKKIVKKLSKEEIKAKKKNINRKNKNSNFKIKKNIKKDEVIKNKAKEIITTYNSSEKSIDICLKIKKCDIDSISNYLIKLSNEKDFPNISIKE